MPEYQKDPNEIGALWKGESKKTGEKYYYGSVVVDGKKLSINIFKNKYKTPGTKVPDLLIKLSNNQATTAPNRPAPAAKAPQVPQRAPARTPIRQTLPAPPVQPTEPEQASTEDETL